MPAPTISSTTSIPLGTEGRSFLLQLSASETPTSWAVQSGKLPPGLHLSGVNISVTPDATTDLLTAAEHGLSDREQVRFASGTLPAPLALATDYYVVAATRDTLQLATEPGGSAIDITGPETGPFNLQRWPLGRISGTPTLAGIYVASLTATNGTGTSDPPLELAFGIEVGEIDSGSAVEIDIDLDTGIVSNPGAPNEWPLSLKGGDQPLISVGFTRGGVLQSLPIALIALGAKRIEPEELLLLNDGVAQRVGPFFAPRYLIQADLAAYEASQTLARWFGDAEGDLATELLGLFEFEWVEEREVFEGTGAELFTRSSRTFRSLLTRDLIPTTT